MANRYTAIDLFAGAGGFSLAASLEYVDVLAAIELDARASETYQKNLLQSNDTTLLLNQDINKVDIKGLMVELGVEKGELDILLGGPPCQGFSSHRILDAGIDDPRNNLLIKYFEFVQKLNPKTFLLENVPGLLWKKHEKYLAKFIELAKNHGYRIIADEPQIINAKNFGVPQNRRRAFIFAVRDDLDFGEVNWPPVKTHSDKPADNALPVLHAISVFEKPSAEILEDLMLHYATKHSFSEKEAQSFVSSLLFGEPIEASDPCNVHMNHTQALVDRFRQTPLNGSREDLPFRLPCHVNYKGHKDVYGRIIFHKPSNTITTGCNNPSKGRFVHPWLNHGITLRHAARLQSFPDSFVFCGNNTEQARQIGNAVPVQLGRILVREIIKIIQTLKELKKQAA